MQRFVIEGGTRLQGEIRPAGSKNSALPLLSACLLTDQPVTLQNVPPIQDVRNLVALIRNLGVSVEYLDETETVVRVHAAHLSRTDVDPVLSKSIRGSLLLAGPLLARAGEVILPRPGGDAIGRRRIDTHLLAFEALGVSIDIGESYTMRAPKRPMRQGRPPLRGAEIFLDEASVTGTENAIMAAVLAEGQTTILNAASEPHVQELCRMLNQMGARVGGIGTNALTIIGVERLNGTTYTIESDHLEVGSFIGLAAVTDSAITIRDAVPQHLRMVRLVYERLGVRFEVRGNDIFVPDGQELRLVSDVHGAIPKIDDAPWPGFPADLLSIVIILATQAQGEVLIFEKMFESRLFFVDKLVAMGARIVLCDPHRVLISGPCRLRGETLTSPDIRAGMALLLAALCANGTSTIYNIDQIDRGYAAIDTRLAALGARISRIMD